MCYNNKAVGRKANGKEYQENFQKKFEEGLDKLKEM